MTSYHVSPSYRLEKLASGAIEDRIDVYEDRMEKWLLGPTRALLAVPNSEIAILNLCLSYFEGWEQYHSGERSRGRSEVFFRRGVMAVFPSSDFGEVTPAPDARDKMADALYDQLRCGMAHDGLPRNRVFITKLEVPVAFSADKATGTDIGGIFVDPRRFLEHIEHHCREYIKSLRIPANVELRANFMATWERAYAGSPAILPPGMMPPPPSIPG